MESVGTPSSQPQVTAVSHGKDKLITRFKVMGFKESYTPSYSGALLEHTDRIWTLIAADRKGKNEPEWAECCFSLQRKTVKGHLGHPRDKVVSIGRFFSQAMIHSKEDLYNHFILHLPRNAKKEIRLPQINMRHPLHGDQSSEGSSSIKTKARMKPVTGDCRCLSLEALVDDLTDKNKDLDLEVTRLWNRLQVSGVNKVAEEALETLQKSHDHLDGRQVVYLLQQQEQTKKIKEPRNRTKKLG